MDTLRTHGDPTGASAIRPEQINAVSAHAEPAQALQNDLWLADLHGLGIVNLRGKGVYQMLARGNGWGVANIGELVRSDEGWIAGLTVDEALLLTAEAKEVTGLVKGFSSEKDGSLITVTDMTHGYCALAVGGAQVQRVLAMLTGLDLRARSFPSGSVAQTSVAKLHALLLRADIGDIPAYLALVGRSVGAYLWDVIVDVSQAEGTVAIDGNDLRTTWLSP
ncbi:MAG: hypothetical protein R3191_05580 [Anaerolineales bacterium]|nr:hypothetical protein [Anaerolineales bacterium]